MEIESIIRGGGEKISDAFLKRKHEKVKGATISHPWFKAVGIVGSL